MLWSLLVLDSGCHCECYGQCWSLTVAVTVNVCVNVSVKQSKSVSSVERLLKKKSKFNFTFERDESLPAHLRTGGEATVNLGSLDVAFVSDERFVVGHGVREGKDRRSVGSLSQSQNSGSPYPCVRS